MMGIRRVLIGSFKKIVLADSLAYFALNNQNSELITSTSWMWVLVFAYALRIYLDFSGYTDIALGVALFMGVSLPENFNNPYAKLNITAFWNSWHITLAQWFRSYVFNPFTRTLRANYEFLPAWFVIFSGQILTMSLIGIWHGITWNFLIWGLWHGIGLFLQNRWSDWIRMRLPLEGLSPFAGRIIRIGGWALTFLFVCLGWVWFATPTPALALDVFRILFGISG
jgi:alginate O-acetyltransferase complex protein AlgI